MRLDAELGPDRCSLALSEEPAASMLVRDLPPEPLSEEVGDVVSRSDAQASGEDQASAVPTRRSSACRTSGGLASGVRCSEGICSRHGIAVVDRLVSLAMVGEGKCVCLIGADGRLSLALARKGRGAAHERQAPAQHRVQSPCAAVGGMTGVRLLPELVNE